MLPRLPPEAIILAFHSHEWPPIAGKSHARTHQCSRHRSARAFRPRNERVYADPRSRIVIEDAKGFFAAHRAKYDIIVSEPSNPWVSGVAGLFSAEFYAMIKRHLNEGGVMAQWLHLYELAPELVVSVIKAMGSQFGGYAVYAVGPSDIVVRVLHEDARLQTLDEYLSELKHDPRNTR